MREDLVNPDEGRKPSVTHVPENPLPCPDVPISITLTYEDGSSASIKVRGRDPEKPIHGVIWGDAIAQAHAHGIPFARPDREHYTWLAIASNSPEVSVCRWEDGYIVCTPA